MSDPGFDSVDVIKHATDRELLVGLASRGARTRQLANGDLNVTVRVSVCSADRTRPRITARQLASTKKLRPQSMI